MNFAHQFRGPLGQKVGKIVSTAIRDSARGQTCTMRSDWCNHDPSTVVFCHAPVRRFGLGGMGMKVPDLFGYYGCHMCHAHESDMGWDDILRAMCETQMRLLAAGLIVVPR
ncbi:nuclease domain-containing protein [Paracoccus sp. (in: a-proteobacteria)]|uniref:nuclease domain-containing protein n=1 Tax=Paracoccus sp. TaxID=267 RepID=UPI0028A11703|nr:nuclease domain-containing protein [Paracoccus sp. (in: a-proteobacteria)]